MAQDDGGCMLTRQPLSETEHLEKITRVILFTALNFRPLSTAGVKEVLEIAMDHEIEGLKDWFYYETMAIVSGKKNDNGSDRWGELEAQLLVTATLRQIPIRKDDARGRVLWTVILGNKRYATIALQAFQKDAKDLAEHMGQWWDIEPPNREGDLKVFVKQLTMLIPKWSQLESLLKHMGGGWSKSLRMAVNEELKKLQLPEIFPPDIEDPAPPTAT